MHVNTVVRIVGLALLCWCLTACGSDPPTNPDLDFNNIDSGAGDMEVDLADPDGALEDGVDDDGDAEDADEDDPPPSDVDDDCTPEECAIDGECVENEASNPDNPCEICSVLTDRGGWTPNDAATCDDGDLCTAGDHCFEGECSALVLTCDDLNPCTADSCDEETGECSNEPAAGECEDGDPCTVGDSCGGGSCQPGSGTLTCNDGNLCTADRCEPGVGCVADALDAGECDDGNACTVGDSCSAGRCQAGTGVLACDDDDLCTIDGCNPASGCVYEDVSHLCSDDNVCTDEACDPERGCVFPFNSVGCDDDSLCTDNDSCREGACYGDPVDTTGDVCNVLSCDPDTGVSVEYTTQPCEDGNLCTLNDVCDSGTCEEGSGVPDCDDENECTDDDCDPAEGCTNVDNTIGCNDDDLCTDNDACSGGSCGGRRITCDDLNECTTNGCQADIGCDYDLIIANDCRPVIQIETPRRAATLTGSSTIEVRGTVTSGAGAITSFTVNGDEVTVGEDGGFETTVPAVVGGNLLVFRASDEWFSERKRVQSFLWSPRYRQPTEPKEGMIDPGLGLYLGDEVLDDGTNDVENPSDFADIFALVLAGFDLFALLHDDPTDTSAVNMGNVVIYTLWVEGINTGTRTVTLTPMEGKLRMVVVIEDVAVRINAKNFLGGNNRGWMYMDAITITADVTLSVNDQHELVASVPEEAISVAIALADPAVTFDGGGLFDGIREWLFNSFIGSFTTTIEEAFKGSLTGTLEDIMTSGLGGLAFDQIIPFPSLANPEETIDVRLVTDFSDIDTSADGIGILERAAAYAEDVNLYDNRGAMGRANCGELNQTMVLHTDSALEIALSDDLLNQLLYAAWQGGLLEFVVPAELLGDVELPPGVTDLTLTIKGMLQPTASDCNVDETLRLFIGDMWIEASMSVFGAPLDADIYVSFEADLILSATDEGIAMSVGGDDVLVESEITIRQDAFLSLESTFADLINDSLVPSLLDLLGGDALGSFPLPEIDLSTIDGVPPGTTIAIAPEDVFRELGNTFVQGGLK